MRSTMQTSSRDIKTAATVRGPAYDKAVAAAQFSSFGKSLLSQIESGKTLSPRQIECLNDILAKRDAMQSAKKAPAMEVNLSPIHAMFEKAQAAGLSRLAYRAEGLTLSLAKAASANPGAIYVKAGDDYLGKVIENKFLATNAATNEHKRLLNVIAENPVGVARAYGKRTGICSCCGRELTDPVSIENGIGPICESKWF